MSDVENLSRSDYLRVRNQLAWLMNDGPGAPFDVAFKAEKLLDAGVIDLRGLDNFFKE